MTGDASLHRLAAQPGFSAYAAARTVSAAGNVMSMVAMPVLVYQLTGSAAWTGFLGALGALPYLLFGLPAGALADRWDNRRVMITWSLAAGVAMLSIPLAHLTDRLSAAHLLIVAGAAGTAFVFSDAASFGALPQLVERALLGPATATLSAIYTSLSVVGPGVAGLLISVLGAPWVVAMDGVAYLTAAALLAGLPWKTETPAGPPADRSLRREITEGLTFIYQHPVIRPLTFMGVGNSVTGGAVAGLIVVLGVEQLDLPDSDGRLGLLYAAAAIGAFLGSVVLSRLQRRFSIGTLTLTGYVVVTATAASVGVATSWAGAAVLLVVFDLVSMIVILNGIVTRQTLTPTRLQSRVNTTARMIAWGGAPLGAGIGGLLASRWGVGPALVLASTGALTALVGGALAHVGHLPRLTDIETPVDE